MKPHERNLGHVDCALEGSLVTNLFLCLPWFPGRCELGEVFCSSTSQSNLIFCQRPKETGLSDHRLKSWKPFLSQWLMHSGTMSECQPFPTERALSILSVVWCRKREGDAGDLCSHHPHLWISQLFCCFIPASNKPPWVPQGYSLSPVAQAAPMPLLITSWYPLYVLAFCSSVASSDSAAYSLQTDLQSPSPLLTT